MNRSRGKKSGHRLSAMVVSIALVVAACSPSQVDPDATVTIAGRLADQSGTPLPGRRVVLAPQTQISELLGGTLFTALSLGTLCLADSPPEPCASLLRGSNSTDTGGDGAFSFRLKGSDIRTFFGNAQSMAVSAAMPSPSGSLEGPATLSTFRVQTEELDLGAIRFWEPQLTTGTGSARWDPIPADFGSGSGYQLEFAALDGSPVWNVQAGRTEAAYDPRVLEDSSGKVSVTATRNGVAPGSTTRLSYRSAQLAFKSGAGVPDSRGESCTLQTGGGLPVTLPGCPLTDGRLTDDAQIPAESPVPAGTAAPAESRWVIVDMGRQMNASLLVLRGCNCMVEGSVDGSNWMPVGKAADFEEIKPARPVRVRYIRAGGPGSSLSQLREVSVWS